MTSARSVLSLPTVVLPNLDTSTPYTFALNCPLSPTASTTSSSSSTMTSPFQFPFPENPVPNDGRWSKCLLTWDALQLDSVFRALKPVIGKINERTKTQPSIGSRFGLRSQWSEWFRVYRVGFVHCPSTLEC